MGMVANAIRSANNPGAKTGTSASGTVRGGNNEANYGGVASGQGIDWETTAHMRGYFDGVWRDSPLGRPVTYAGILSAAAHAGERAGLEGLDTGLGAAGNAGQESIIAMMGPDVMNNAWHYQVNGYGSAADYIRMHCAYPSAVEGIIDEMDSVVEGVYSE